MNEGARIGPYVIEGELGRGGMGVVVRGRDPAGRAVAIKRVVVRDDELARRLVREADVRVVHPNVVRVLGAGLDERGEPYVVTELLEGESLAERILRERERGVRDVSALVALFAQAADGLAALHAAGIVHRDVKPSNLFITREGTLKVLDFGTAAFSDASTMTLTGALVGTPAYLSPEQARGGPVDARTDVWGLGMSLYVALTDELPFRRSSAVATALAVQLDPLPSVLERAPFVTPELASLIERCLARRPAGRPSNAAEVARALRAIDSEAVSRPTQPLLAPSEHTWRSVVVVLIDGAADRERVDGSAAELGGMAFPVFARAAVVVFGAAVSRGDELERAIALALRMQEDGCAVVVADARARAGGRELDPASLEAAAALLERSEGGVMLAPRAAAFAGLHVELERRRDGTARVLAIATPRASTVLAGRDAEIGALERAARRTAEGAFVHVEIVGEAGMGKSALVRAFAERVGVIEPDAACVMARTVDAGSSPYAPLLDALRISVDEAGQPQEVLDRRRVGVVDRLGELLVTAPLLVLFIEDVPDADAHTAALVADLRSLFEHRPLLLVTTARRATSAEGDALRLVLNPLGAASIAALVEPLLGSAAARREAAALAARTGGNPLFALHLAGAQGLTGDEAYVPLTIESAVQAQLDALPDELRRATHTMALFGSEGTLVEARLALGSRGDRWVADLTAAGVLEPTQAGDRAGWQFRSRIVAEVARAALDAPAAARLHREIASRLAEAWDLGSPGAPGPERVLRHAEGSGDDALTARFVLEAFFVAAGIGDGRRVLELLPQAREAGGARFAIALAAAEAAAFVGEGVEPLLEEALEHALNADERALARAELGERARRSGRLAEARGHLEQALTEAAFPAIAARTRCRLALVRISEGDAKAALALMEPELPELPVAIRALVADTRGYVHGACGALGPRCEAYERAARLYAEAGDARRAAGANANLGDSLRQLGDFGGAEAALRRAIDGARRVGNGLTEAYACTNLAATLSTLGRRREALATLDLAAARAEAVGDARLGLVITLHRARAESRAPTEAELELARADPTLTAMALAVLLDHGEVDEARITEAAALLERDDIEEGALELGRALHARRPSERARTRMMERIGRTYRTLHRPEWRATYAEYVGRAFGGIAEPWLAER